MVLAGFDALYRVLRRFDLATELAPPELWERSAEIAFFCNPPVIWAA
jgi:hypothetical protein